MPVGLNKVAVEDISSLMPPTTAVTATSTSNLYLSVLVDEKLEVAV